MDTQKRLLEKLFRSECTETELIILLNLFKDEKGKHYDDVMQRLWEEIQQCPSLQSKHSELIYDKTISKIRQNSTNVKTIKTAIISRRGKFLKRLSAAAAILIIGGYAWNWQSEDQLVLISTAYAETKTVQLPDGSTVELNAGSELSYQESWCNTCDRQVYLKGEAFFEVEKKQTTGQKFQVVTSDLAVEVLGTSFNVNTLHDQTQVILEEGKVKLDLKEEKETLLMEPGDIVTYSFQTKKREKQYFKKDGSIVWRDGFTSMQNISLIHILQKVEDIYGQKFDVVNDDNLSRKFTVGIPVDNIETTIAVLKEVTKLEITKHENIYRVE